MMQACMAVLTEEQKTALNERLTAPSWDQLNMW